MSDWRPRLERWVRAWGRLAELTRDCFPVRPAAGGWPAALPPCPALADYYGRCDGGTFGPYTLDPAAALADAAAEFAGGVGFDPAPGVYVRVGTHEYGHVVLWDAAADEVVLYGPDDEAPRRLGRTADRFLARLFRPAAGLWADALAEADAADPGMQLPGERPA